MRVLIVGAGAIGSVLGGFLAKGGHEVTCLGRAWHLDAIRVSGLRITGLWGDHLIRDLLLATDPTEVKGTPPFDWLFVCVKAHQTASAAELLPKWLSAGTLVCAFQNGLGNYETLCQHVPPARIALGRVIFGVDIKPGHVRVTVCADEVLIGAVDPQCPREPLTRLVSTLQSSGIATRATTTILSVLWAKVLYNGALNGLSTLLEVPYGKLPEHSAAHTIMRGVIEEAYQVAAAHHVALEPSTADAYLALLFQRLIPDTAAHRASMLHDVQRGKLTEIDALNGAIVRLGEQAGIPTPMNALVTRLVHAKEQFWGGKMRNVPVGAPPNHRRTTA